MSGERERGGRWTGREGEDTPVGPDCEMPFDQLGQARIDWDDAGVFDQRGKGRGSEASQKAGELPLDEGDVLPWPSSIWLRFDTID